VRVVSLVPSVTETLLAWGIAPVAVTRFCEQPGFVTVGGTKDPDVAAIVALRPDLVVVDNEENRRDDADALRAAGLALHVTTVHSVADVAPCLEALAAAVHAPFRPQGVNEWAPPGPSGHRVRERGCRECGVGRTGVGVGGGRSSRSGAGRG
jgi:ABC-type hemin transport system substrate-binding protein